MNAGKGVKLESWKNMTHGAHVFEAGNAVNFKTGDWRSDKPIFISENCKQCLLCFPVCPDSAIVLEDGQMQGFNYDFCKGCLVCMMACPFKAIEKEGV
ncbi:MAG: 4Fe-4S binding protein [Defluviitaleaceae bacterium]|nr:4Fe-4S binding protein [Defluviitaleaceae bacterium]